MSGIFDNEGIVKLGGEIYNGYPTPAMNAKGEPILCCVHKTPIIGQVYYDGKKRPFCKHSCRSQKLKQEQEAQNAQLRKDARKLWLEVYGFKA